MFTSKKTQELKERELALAERQADIEEGKARARIRLTSLLAEERSSVAQPVAVQAPQLPDGVVPKGKTAAVAMDSCQGLYDYATTGDPSFFSTFLGYPALAAMSQSSDYRSVPETTATEMTREWGRFKVENSDTGGNAAQVEREQEERLNKINALTDAFKAHDIRSLIRKAIEVEMTMGRAQIYIKLKTARDDLPFVMSTLGVGKDSLEGFRLIEPMWSTPSVYNAADPTALDFYKPSKWFVLGREVHADRLMTLVMRPVPDMLKPAYNFGGLSMLQLMKPYVERYQRTADSISQIVRSFSMTILGTDMSGILADGEGDGDLWLRVGLFNKYRDNSNTMLLDKESEEISQINTPLTALPELLTKSQEQMAAPSHTPLVKLLGITPSGLNASSDGEIRVYYDFIMAQNEAHIRPIIERISTLLQLSMFGEVDNSIVWKFNPLYQLDAKELAEAQDIKGRNYTQLMQSGAVSGEEVRKALAADEDSAFTGIDVDDLPEMPDMGMFGELAQDSDFEESKVKRDKDGKFTAQGSGNSSSSGEAPKEGQPPLEKEGRTRIHLGGENIDKQAVEKAKGAALREALRATHELNSYDIDEEIQRLEESGDVGMSEIFENPEYWNSEDEELTDAGVEKTHEIYKRQALENLDLPDIATFEDIKDAHQFAQHGAAMEFFDQLGINYESSRVGSTSRYLVVYGENGSELKLRFADHAKTTSNSSHAKPDVNVAPGADLFTDAISAALRFTGSAGETLQASKTDAKPATIKAGGNRDNDGA